MTVETIEFKLTDDFGDGVTVEVTENNVCIFNDLRDFGFTKEQFLAMSMQVKDAFEKLSGENSNDPGS